MLKIVVGCLLFFSLSVILAVTVIIDPMIAEKIYKKFNDSGCELRRFYQETVSYQLRIDQNIPAGYHLFVGDSIIQGLCVSCVMNNAINFGIGRDTTFGVARRIERYRSVKAARSIFLSVGLNDFKYRGIGGIVNNYRKILEIPPNNINLIVNAVLPINVDMAGRLSGYPEKISELNIKLKKICEEERSNCFFLDLTEQFSDSKGYLKRELQMGDGVHLNRRGNTILLQKIKEVYSNNALIRTST